MKKIILFLVLSVFVACLGYAKTYRVQTDISFKNEADAESYLDYVQTLRDKIYVPTVEERSKREDLWTTNRMNLIWDYDDEGINRQGEARGSIDIMGDYETKKKAFKEAKQSEVFEEAIKRQSADTNRMDMGGLL